MKCVGCGQEDECRLGYCFDCACRGEWVAARRTVIQHLGRGFSNLYHGAYINARVDFKWTWERLTGTGDYRPGGEFERQYGINVNGVWW